MAKSRSVSGDQSVADLTAEITEAITVVKSTTVLVNGIQARIDQAVADVIANNPGITEAQLAPVVNLGAELKAEVASLSAAVAANTPGAPPTV